MAPRYVGPAKWHGAANNKPINRIVIHATAGAEPGSKGAAASTVAYSKKTDRPSSYHYVADSSTVLQYVYDSVVAYGAPPNQHALHFELCCSLSKEGRGHWGDADHQKMLRLAAEEVADLCAEYNVPIVFLTYPDLQRGKRGITGHKQVSDAWGQTSHWDPGPYFPWKQFIQMVKDASKPPAKETGMTPALQFRKMLLDACKFAATHVPKGRTYVHAVRRAVTTMATKIK